MAAADRLDTVDGAGSDPYGGTGAVHLPVGRVRVRDRAVRADGRRATVRAPQQQRPDTVVGGPRPAATGRPSVAPGRSAGPAPPVRGLHPVRPGAPAAVPSDPGVPGGHAASHAQDHAQRVRAVPATRTPRLRRLSRVRLCGTKDARQLPVRRSH